MNTKATLITWFAAAAVATSAQAALNYSFTNFAGNPGGSGNADGTGVAARFNNPGAVVADSMGNVYVADTQNHTIRRITLGGVVTTIAGTPGLAGNVDGAGAAARFDAPTGIAMGIAGDLYVADYGSSTIRHLTVSGTTWSVKTVAGIAGTTGKADGSGTTATFSSPSGVAVDALGNVYVSDTGNAEIRRITLAGTVTTLVSNSISITTNNILGSTNLYLSSPHGIAVDAVGNIYVADNVRGLIYKFTPGGVIIPGDYGPNDDAIYSVDNPTGVAVDSGGYVYFTSQDSEYVTVLYPYESYYEYDRDYYLGLYESLGLTIDLNGNIFVADTKDNIIDEIPGDGQEYINLAGSYSEAYYDDGVGTGAYFDHPEGLAIDIASNFYVADTDNQTIRIINTNGLVTGLAGGEGYEDYGFEDGPGYDAVFDDPAGLAVAGNGSIYVADYDNDRIQVIAPATGKITTFSIGTNYYFSPEGLAFDSAGNLYVTDQDYDEVDMISPAGVITVLPSFPFNSPTGIAVNGSGVYVADGNQIYMAPIGGTASILPTNTASGFGFSNPTGVALDSSNNLYVADSSHNRIVMITPAGFATNIAGTNTLQTGHLNGIGTNAQFNDPTSVATDTAGNLYVADYGNNSIRLITLSNWSVTTIAGGGASGTTSGSSNGIGTNALFRGPYFVTVNPTNNGILYVSDSGNEVIRQLTLTGGSNWVVTTLAGVLGSSSAVAYFNSPAGVTVNSALNVYVADTGNSAIRSISPAGIVSTIAGNGEIGSADGSGGNASFYYPQSVAVDVSNNVYVADTYNHTIRKITASNGVWTVSTLAGNAGYAGSSNGVGSGARFWAPGGVAVGTNPVPNIYVADTYNNTIRMIAQSIATNGVETATVSTIAGTGTAGSVDGAGASKAEFNHPYGIVVYTSNGVDTVYVADSYNQTIRMLSLGTGITKGSAGQTWNVVTVAGTPGVIGGGIVVGLNGVGPGAEFDYPMGVAVDPLGNVAVADTGNNRITLDAITGRFEGPDAPSSPGAPGETTVSPIVIDTNSGTTIDGLILVTSGSGTIQHTWKTVASGKQYTVKAVAGAGYVFAEWVGGTDAASYAVLGDTASYTFTMAPGLVLEAVFVPNPFPAAVGVYNGLFSSSDGVTEATAGMLKGLIVSKTGSYSGTILIDGGTHSIHGSFSAYLQASNEITHVAGGSLPVLMTLAPPLVTGSVGTAALQAELATNQTPADYTMAITGASSSADGTGAITGKKDVADITGKLSDGTKFSQSVGVAQTGDVPFYSSLYGNKGLILGWINLYNTNVAQPGLTWIKPAAFTNNDSVTITPK